MYLKLATIYSQNQGSHDLFMKLSDEEKQHAQRVHMLRSMYLHDQKILKKEDIDEGTLDAILAHINEILTLLRSKDYQTPLQEALKTVVHVENKFAVAHAEAVAEKTDARLSHFFKDLAKQDEGHKELLQQMLLAAAEQAKK